MQPTTLASRSVALLRYLPQKPKRSSRAKRADPDMMLTRYAVAPLFFIACSSSFTAASSALPAVVTCGNAALTTTLTTALLTIDGSAVVVAC